MILKPPEPEKPVLHAEWKCPHCGREFGGQTDHRQGSIVCASCLAGDFTPEQLDRASENAIPTMTMPMPDPEPSLEVVDPALHVLGRDLTTQSLEPADEESKPKRRQPKKK